MKTQLEFENSKNSKFYKFFQTLCVSETSFQIPDTVRVETLYLSHFLAENPIAVPPSSLVKGVRRDMNIQPPLPLLHFRCTRGSPLGQGYRHTGVPFTGEEGVAIEPPVSSHP